MTFDHNSSELRIHNHSNEPSSSNLVPKVVPPVDKTTASQHDTQPTLNAPPTSELINPPTNVNAEENM
ncbi:hypothetical protein Tco_0555200, partial [Tanacetum coccineum]